MSAPPRTTGTYACTGRHCRNGRVVKVAYRGPVKAARPRPADHWRVACPVCGNEHIVAVWWREARKGRPEHPEIIVGADG